MKEIIEWTRRNSWKPFLKFFSLSAFIVTAVCLFHFTSFKDFLSPDALENLIEQSGFWAPLVFVLIHAASICLFLPASLLTVLGAAIFGAYWGFLYVWIGAMAGASGGFFIGRTLGRDFVSGLMGNGLRKYDKAIERNGFLTVLYLRLINLPFTPLNFGMGLTRVRFRDFILGTGLGVIGGLFVLTFFGVVLRDAWVSGNWERLVSPKAFIAVSLMILLMFVPVAVIKIRGKAA